MKPIAELKQLTDLHAVARALGIAEWPNKAGICCSPLRPDRSESFSIFESKGELFWKDHGTGEGGDLIRLIQIVRGCDIKEAVSWLAAHCGVKREEKSVQRKPSAWKDLELISIYDYRAADGVLKHQTLRYKNTATGEKTFRQRRVAKEGEIFGKYQARRDPVHGGWWIWTMTGIEPVLYRSDEIVNRPSETVWIFEGEKDADNAAALGLLATTSPMGAGKWRPSYTELLKGRSVHLCADRDDAGRGHAVAILKALTAAGSRVHVVDWPSLWPEAPTEGKVDFTDFVEAINGSVSAARQLLDRIEKA